MTFNIAKLSIFSMFLNVFWSLLKMRFELLLKIPNCSRSWNAIKTNEKSWKPLILDLQNDGLINIPQVLQRFWNLLEARFQALPIFPK